MLELGIFSVLAMILFTNRTTWEAAAGITLIAGLAAGAVLYLRRKKPTEEELERALDPVKMTEPGGSGGA